MASMSSTNCKSINVNQNKEPNWITLRDGIDPSRSHWEDSLNKTRWALKEGAIKPVGESMK
jgi:hypothetical protein